MDRQAQTSLRQENACEQRLLADLVEDNRELIDAYLKRLFHVEKPPETGEDGAVVAAGVGEGTTDVAATDGKAGEKIEAPQPLPGYTN